jgi:hypothetical protein
MFTYAERAPPHCAHINRTHNARRTHAANTLPAMQTVAAAAAAAAAATAAERPPDARNVVRTAGEVARRPSWWPR